MEKWARRIFVITVCAYAGVAAWVHPDVIGFAAVSMVIMVVALIVSENA